MATIKAVSPKERASVKDKLRREVCLKEQIDLAKAELDLIKSELVATLVSFGISKVAFEGYEHSVYNGTNVTIGRDRLKDVLLGAGIKPAVAASLVEKATTRTSYTTMVIKRAAPSAECGGLTG